MLMPFWSIGNAETCLWFIWLSMQPLVVFVCTCWDPEWQTMIIFVAADVELCLTTPSVCFIKPALLPLT